MATLRVDSNDMRDLQFLCDKLNDQKVFLGTHKDYLLLKRCLSKLIMMAGMKTDYPVQINLKILENYLRLGAEIKEQDGRWCLFRANGEKIVGGKSLQVLLENLIWRDC